MFYEVLLTFSSNQLTPLFPSFFLICFVVSGFQTDYYIAGIGPLDENLVILGYAKELDEDGKAQRPVMYVVQPEVNNFLELRYDSLSLRGYQHLKCNDYHLGLFVVVFLLLINLC